MSFASPQPLRRRAKPRWQPGSSLRRNALANDLGLNLNSWDTPYIEFVTRMIRDRIDERSFEKAWAQGRTLNADEAVALALESLG